MSELGALLVASLAGACSAQTFSLRADWSETQNPSGPWSLNEGEDALPRVEGWERTGPWWAQPQGGWARSALGTDRIPFWFRSNGSETFAHDWELGDTVVHTQDEANGVGNGPAEAAWTSPVRGRVTISGGVWMGRDIGRANDWTLLRGSQELSGGSIRDGDPYSRANPFRFADGSGGPGALHDMAVTAGAVVRLRLTRTSQFGDFVGVDLAVSLTAACPGDCDTGTGPGLLDIFDFLCFQNFFAASHRYACDFDTGTGSGACDIFDFLAFQNAFASGCP